MYQPGAAGVKERGLPVSPAALVHRLANTLAFERRCRGPVPGRVSSRDKGDPRRGGQAQERARRRTISTPHKRATSTPDAARGSLGAAEKAAPLATGACGVGTHRQPFVGLPAPRSAHRQAACAVLGRPSRSDGASASPRLPTLPGTGPSLPLRCASSPYSTVCLSRAPCWRGASTLSVRQAIYETVH